MKKIIFLCICIYPFLYSCTKDKDDTKPPYNASANVNTNEVDVIDCSSADFSGAISTGVVFTENGIVYATTKNPTTSNTKLVDLSSGNTITASAYTLSPSTKYYYRAYIIKSGIVEYGGEGSFSTVACTGNPVDNNFYLNLTADGNQINSRQMKAGQITNECMMS